MINVPIYPGTVQGVGWRQGLVGQGHGSPAGDLVTWRLGMRLLGKGANLS